MPNHIWSLVCQRAVIDKFTNQLSLLNIVETVQAAGPKPPSHLDEKGKPRQVLMPVNWCVVSFYVRSRSGIPERFEEVCAIKGPNGKEILESRQAVLMEKDDRMRVISGIPFIPFAGFGDYRIVIQLVTNRKRRKVDELVIPFTHVPRPPINGELVQSNVSPKAKGGRRARIQKRLEA